MRLTVQFQWIRTLVLIAACASLEARARGDDVPPVPDSPLVKLLKSGRVPEARQGTILEMIGKRGTAADLEFLYQRALSADGFPPAIRVKAFTALAEAASTRDLRPSRDIDKLIPLLRATFTGHDPALEKGAIRLAGLWKLEAAGETLRTIAQSPTAEDEIRTLALEALAGIGGRVGLSRIEALAGPDQPVIIRLPAVAALVKLDVKAAAACAVELLPQAAAQGRDLIPLLAAFLDRQGGGDILAASLARHSVPADSARLALRSVFALGHADTALVNALSRAAGLATETKPLTPAELNAMVAEVAAKGDPARGELIFRRPDLNCTSCHSVNKAGGDVGPDLSSIGQTSPSDYIINSILVPDQSIKEQFHTLVVLTSDGQVFQGIVTDKDDQRIVLKDATGAPRVVPVASIEDQKPGGSLMPKGLVNLMTRPEFVDLVRFLSDLGKPGPYAIRATPAIQRWRVLKTVPDALCGAVPDRSVFRDQVLQAGPDRWTSAYAKVNGSLPLNELTGSTGGKPLYLQGELNVTTGGPIRIQLDAADGARLWVDDQLAGADSKEFTTALAAGRHAITLRIDPRVRSVGEIKVEINKPTGSEAEFTVVGGR
jgi:putative heme-binding domain-containing protein